MKNDSFVESSKILNFDMYRGSSFISLPKGIKLPPINHKRVTSKQDASPIGHYCRIGEKVLSDIDSGASLDKSDLVHMSSDSSSNASYGSSVASPAMSIDGGPKHTDVELESALLKMGSSRAAKRAELSKKAEIIKSGLVVDALALEWLDVTNWDDKTLACLVDKLLPVLIKGLVRVLEVAESRQLLEEDRPDPDFNPLHFLARYLLRNNPKHGNFREDDAYVWGLRHVAEKLRRRQEKYTGNRLLFLKSLVNRRRRKCEMLEYKKDQENLRRTNGLKEMFYFWNNGKRIPLIMAQNALLSYNSCETSCGRLELKSDWMNSKGVDNFLQVDKFIKYIMEPTADFTADQFDDFIEHMEKAGVDFQAIARQNEVIYQLQQLFHTCDVIKIEYLDKAKVMKLLSDFYLRLTEAMQEKLNNPKFWPFSEVVEVSENATDEISVEKPWMMVDFENVEMHPPDDYILEECPPDEPMAEILKTPLDGDKPYVDFFYDLNVKFAALDYPRYQEEEMLKMRKIKKEFQNLKTFNLEPKFGDVSLPQSGLKEKVELGNKLNILPVWKLLRVNGLDKEQDLISRGRFCGMVMNFLGPAVDNQEVINKLGVFLVEGCKMRDDEKVSMLYKWKAIREHEKNILDISETFELWDSNASGHLSLDFVMDKVRGLKIFSDSTFEFDVMKAYRAKFRAAGNTMNKKQFRALIDLLIKFLPENISSKVFLKDFLNSYDPGPMKMRSLEAKKQLIHQVLLQATYWPNDLRPVFAEVFSIMKKDDYEILSEKFLSSTISLLKRKDAFRPEEGHVLTLVAKTTDKRFAELGSCLRELPESCSYKVINTKEMMVIQKLIHHPNPSADFWDRHSRKEIGNGQMIFVPIMDEHMKVLGVFAIDNLPVVLKAEDERRISLVEGRIDFMSQYLLGKRETAAKGMQEREGSTDKLQFAETSRVKSADSAKKAGLKKRELERNFSLYTVGSVSMFPWIASSSGLLKTPSSVVQKSQSKMPKQSMISHHMISSYSKTFNMSTTSLRFKSKFKEDKLKVSNKLSGSSEDSMMIREEKIEFFQGIAKVISIAIHEHSLFTDVQKCFKEMLESFSYLVPFVTWCGVYRVAYDISVRDFFLQEMVTYHAGDGLVVRVPNGQLPILERIKNLYRPFLFASVDSGTPIFGSCLSEYYFTFPLKDLENQVKFLFMVNIGQKMKMTKLEMLNLIFYEKFFSTMHHLIIHYSEGEDQRQMEEPIEMICWSEFQKSLVETFVQELMGVQWYKLACLEDVHIIIRTIFSITMLLLGLKKETNENFAWKEITPYLFGNIARRLTKFQPKDNPMSDAGLSNALATLKEIPVLELQQTNYLPIMHFYNWSMTSLLYTKKYRSISDNAKPFSHRDLIPKMEPSPVI